MNDDNIIRVYKKLAKCVPAIGFLSRRKRILAYLAVTINAQQMLDTEEMSEAEALFVLSMLMRKNKNFQKAGMMAALNLPGLDKDTLKPIGLLYANEVRKNLNLALVDTTNPSPPEQIE